MKLHRIKGGNRYCGPSAISAVTGAATHDIARNMRAITGKRAIMGVSPWLLLEVLRDMSMATIPAGQAKDGTSSPTIAKWLRSRDPGTYILLASNHYSVVRVYKEGRRKLYEWADSCNKKPVPWEEFRTVRVGRRSRVRRAWEIVPKDGYRLRLLQIKRAKLVRQLKEVDQGIREEMAR